jgi:glycosyltransferase involved in cell wall biosynthesis
VGGVPDIIENGVNGCLVESGDFHDMAKKILFLLDNQPLTHQISKNNRIKVQGYAWKNVAHQIERIYLEIL